MKKNLLTFFLILVSFSLPALKAFSQNSDVRIVDSVDTVNPLDLLSPFTFGGYVDVYYSRDNDRDHVLDRFPGVSAHRDEFRLNIAQISAKYAKDNVRGNITLQYGDEPDLFWQSDHKLIQEANVGFSPSKDLWIDAGYFITHIGTESIRPMENTFSTFAMVSFYEPFPQAGVIVSYNTLRFTGAFHLVNGYNLITDNNKNKSIGLSLTFRPFKNIQIIYNNLGGNESSDLGDHKLRLYNNLIFKGQFKNWSIVLNNDFCIQEKSKVDDAAKNGYSVGGFLTAQYRINPKFALALRGEYFMDFDGILSGVYVNSIGESTGLQAAGPSLAFEYKPIDNAYFRIEGRYLKTLKDLHIFSDDRDYRIDGNVTIGVGF